MIPRMSIFRIHFNKQRAFKGYPWTVHFKGQCIPAKQVIMAGLIKSEWLPKKKTNPRAFFSGKASAIEIRKNGKVYCYGF